MGEDHLYSTWDQQVQWRPKGTTFTKTRHWDTLQSLESCIVLKTRSSEVGMDLGV